MGKPTGFLEFKRETPKGRPPQERVRDWEEVSSRSTESKLKTQGARCMDCGVPFCHTGTLLAGMASGCPINNLIPEWNDLVYRGLWQEALERLLKTNNFPEFTGRVCPAPCEGACVLGLTDNPVTIKSIECAIVDKGFEEGWIVPSPPKIRTGKKVAVIGSGPSGLACADQLNKVGHQVTVFERADRIGGLLMYGIPNPHLDKKVVQRRIDLMAAEGVTFVTKTEIGKDKPVGELRKKFDVLVLCGGATKPRDLPIEGRALGGIHLAVPFLSANTKQKIPLSPPSPKGDAYVSARGKDVLVIGGGDTGTDCVATSLRHECRSVVQFEILPKPPLTRAPDNPWPQWPKVYKMEYGQEEAASLFGNDPRQYSILTKRFVGDDEGNVKEAHTVQVEWVLQNGRMVPCEIPGTEKVWPAQLVLLALGFLGPEETLLGELDVERDERTNVKAPEGSYTTSVKGVFAAGDMRRGQSLVVWAIKEGRGAAREVDRFLMGNTGLK